MQLKHITLAVAATLAAPAAFATAPSNAFDTTGALVVYMSGATAPDEFLESIVTGMMNTGFYKYKDNGPGTEYRAFLGEVKNDASIPSSIRNQKVLFIKRSKGGSVWGVDPVARAQGIATMEVSATACSATAGSDGYYTCSAVGNDPAIAAPNGKERVPDFGVSDVAPFMFKEPYNVEFGQTQLSTDEANGLTVRGVNTLMMGIVTTAAVPDGFTLSKADYAAMLTGNLGDWTMVGDGSVAPAGGTQVVVCRRWPGSGTQTSYNWYFNNFPCTGTSSTSGVSGYISPATMDASWGVGAGGSGTDADPYIIDVTAGYTVIENSGSGDVRKCLNAAQNAVDYKFKAPDGSWYKANFSAAGGALAAIGVLSLDSQEKTGAATSAGAPTDKGAESSWYFRELEGSGRMLHGANTTVDETCTASTGVCPNRDNLRDGRYDFAAELTMQYLSTLAGQKKTFADEFIDRAGDPAFQKAWTLAVPPAYTPDGVNAVAKATRFGNMCAPLQKLF